MRPPAPPALIIIYTFLYAHSTSHQVTRRSEEDFDFQMIFSLLLGAQHPTAHSPATVDPGLKATYCCSPATRFGRTLTHTNYLFSCRRLWPRIRFMALFLVRLSSQLIFQIFSDLVYHSTEQMSVLKREHSGDRYFWNRPQLCCACAATKILGIRRCYWRRDNGGVATVDKTQAAAVQEEMFCWYLEIFNKQSRRRVENVVKLNQALPLDYSFF